MYSPLGAHAPEAAGPVFAAEATGHHLALRVAALGIARRARVLGARECLVLDGLIEHLELPVVTVAAPDLISVALATQAVVAAALDHPDVACVTDLA